MKRSTAIVLMDRPKSSMKQLSSHWAHKFPVKLDNDQSYIELPNVLCRMSASADSLSIELEAKSDDELPKMEHVVQVHLERFAYKEKLVFNWTAS